jgi:uncharacterized protein YqeY
MSATRQKIDEALKAAMKARDTVTVETLRFLNAGLRRIEVDERKTLEEAEVIQVIQKTLKVINEAIDAAVAGGREDATGGDKAQRDVLMRFLPQQLTEEQLVALIDAVLAETGATLKKDQGRVMSALMPRIAGVANGKVAAQLVSARLQ